MLCCAGEDEWTGGGSIGTVPIGGGTMAGVAFTGSNTGMTYCNQIDWFLIIESMKMRFEIVNMMDGWSFTKAIEKKT